jgi:hypothetical protein
MNWRRTTWGLILVTLGWLLLMRRLDLLLIAAPVAAVLSYATARGQKKRQNRM